MWRQLLTKNVYRENNENQVQRVQMEHKEHREIKENQVQRVQMERKVHRAFKGNKVFRESLGQLEDLKALKDLKVNSAHRV